MGGPMDDHIGDKELRALYGYPREFVTNAHAQHLEASTIQFIQHSSFFILSSVNQDGDVDISPKGGSPGFVRVVDKTHLTFLDRPGNRKLHTVENLSTNAHVGLMFMVPGVGDFLRLYGQAYATHDTKLISEMGGKPDENKLVIHIEIRKVFPHCPAAARISALWGEHANVSNNVPGVTQMAESLAASREILS
jgi:PPOX class probable FMN-dependent enzyme